MGIRAMALSQAYRRDGERVPFWETSEAHLPGLISELVDLDLPDGTFLNVNLPAVEPDAVKGTRVCHQGRVEHDMHTEERQDGRGKPYHWLRFGRGTPAAQPGSDIAALKDGYISVTPLGTDLTNRACFDAVATRLGIDG